MLNNTEFYQLSVKTCSFHPACWISCVWVRCFILFPAWKVPWGRACLGSKVQIQTFTTGCIFILGGGRNYFTLFKEDLSPYQEPCVYSDSKRLSCAPSFCLLSYISTQVCDSCCAFCNTGVTAEAGVRPRLEEIMASPFEEQSEVCGSVFLSCFWCVPPTPPFLGLQQVYNQYFYGIWVWKILCLWRHSRWKVMENVVYIPVFIKEFTVFELFIG